MNDTQLSTAATSPTATAGSEEYLRVNKANWDDRAVAHAASPDYSVQHFIDHPDAISRVVRFDVERAPGLGSLDGLDVVHLQCHIGTDTLSLKRLGAQRVTGVDLSPKSLEEARRIAAAAGHGDIEYVESDVYSAPEALGGRQFDLVYTGIGALCWLPSIERWAQVVAALLKPGGRLFIREGHPMLWAMGDHPATAKRTLRDDEFTTPAVEFPYFEQEQPLVFDDGGTYVETGHEFTANVTHEWNHGLGEVVTALLNAGLRLDALVEHQSVPWNALPGQMVEIEPNEWQLAENPARLAATYTLTATKPADVDDAGSARLTAPEAPASQGSPKPPASDEPSARTT